MCGIAGIVDYGQKFQHPERSILVEKICALLRHRGPDATGLWQSGDRLCTLGHTRLSIIDLDERSNQPMSDRSQRYHISFNGEIYNFKSLRNELKDKGYHFRTTSDTEVLVEGFSQWGEELFVKLDGMFAIAIYDTVERSLRLVRDRVGEKPLYYCTLGKTVVFSSELKPLLLTPGISHDISEASLFEFLALRYVLDPHTIFEHIHSIQPGTEKVFFFNGDVQERNYFSFDIKPSQTRSKIKQEEFLELIEGKLTDAIEKRLVADVPVGAFLSSGIDSSLVCAIAAKKLGSSVRCFSAGFVNGENNEDAKAKEIAQYLHLPFKAYHVSPDDMLNTASDFGGILDEPNGDRSCVPMYFLSRMVKSDVTVAVSGDGGDELFGGYGRYYPLKVSSESPLDYVNQYFAERLPVFPLSTLKEIFPLGYRQFQQRVIHRFLPVVLRQDLKDIERLRLIDFYSYMPGAVLAKVDRMSMKHSLEVRTPFYEPGILKLSENLPLGLTESNKLLKVALRKILSKYLPQNLILPRKQGFGMPPTFFNQYQSIFTNYASRSDDMLREWAPLKGNINAYHGLKRISRANINSLWAWIILGQWTQSLPNSAFNSLQQGYNRGLVNG